MSVTHRVTVATKTNEEQRISSGGGGDDGKQRPCIEPALALEAIFNLPLSFLYSFLIQIFALKTKLSPFPFEID